MFVSRSGMVYYACFLFCVAAAVVPTSVAFVVDSTRRRSSRQPPVLPISSSWSSSQRQQQQRPIRTNTNGLGVLQSPEVSSTDGSASEDNSNNKKNEDKDWWKSVQFKYGHVAEQIRSDFEILQTTTIGKDKKPLIYLDSGATSQKPKQVVDAISNYYTKLNSNVHRGAHTLSRDATAAFEESRDRVTSFINAKSRNEIIFTSGATEALNLIAYSYGRTNLVKGDEIILTEMEHHSNLIPWQILAESTGAILKFVKTDCTTGTLDLQQMEGLLSAEKTKIVSFQHVSNVMGCINPVSEMVSIIKDKAPNAKIILDACQSVPHMTVNVQELGIDFLAASGHKMCGPTGIGFLWGKEDLLNSMPPFMGGGEMIDQVTLETVTYASSPARFEAGTPPIAQAIGLGSAIQYLQTIGMTDIEHYEHELAQYLTRRLNEVDGVTVLGPPVGIDRAALCAFVTDHVHPSDLSTFLDMEGVAIRAGHHCCQPLHQALGYSHSARASLYIYNTKEDVDMFIEKLEKTLVFFRNLENPSEDEASDDDFVPFI